MTALDDAHATLMRAVASEATVSLAYLPREQAGALLDEAARLVAERDRLRAALEAIRVSPKAAFDWLAATRPDVARRLISDDLGTGTGDVVRAAAAAALFPEED